MTARTEFVENQLGLYFSVGAAEAIPEDLGFERHQAAFEALEASFLAQANDLFGESDVTVSEDFRFVPIELCEFEGESTQLDGQVINSVWFHSSRPFTQDQAQRLRTLVLAAYRTAYGEAARFLKAEIYRKWAVSERGEFTIEG